MKSLLLGVLLVACEKQVERSPAPQQAAAPAAKSKPREAERPPPAPQRTANPELPATHSDANPPGVPRLTGAIQTDRGLSYIDEVVGTGAMPTKGKKVTVHYTGYLTDGSPFDSSHDRDQPIVIPFDTGVVIKGWDIGLATMRVGGKRRLIVPADLGYGEHGMGQAIPPDAKLVFDVELVAAE